MNFSVPPMTEYNKQALSSQIIDKAIEFGACLAGIANVEELKDSPSHTISAKLAEYSGVGTKPIAGRKTGEVVWPGHARSAVVIAKEHPINSPDMDWWLKGLNGGTRGNAQLMAVFARLSNWIETEHQISCIKLAYHIEKGGVFMKDTAVLGGLGCIGENNLLLTPQFGSHIRLRVMLLDVDLPSTGILDFDPCADCREYCRKACPQKAFDTKIYSKDLNGQQILPGRTGVYNRVTCNLQMEADSAAGQEVPIEGTKKTGRLVKYCRQCERACPVGKK